jgi:hypothetical protein
MTENSMKKSIFAIAFAAALAGVGGCGSRAALIGTGTGAAVGAAVRGSTLSTVAGGVVGYAAGKRYDEKQGR